MLPKADPYALFGRALAIFFLVAIVIVIASLVAPHARAANSTWTGGTGGSNTSWLTSTNWNNGSPGIASNSSANTDIATIPATGTNPAIGISGTNESLGAIDLSSTANRAIGASGTTGAAFTLRLNGATVNGVANTILRASSTGTLTIQANNGQATPNTLSLLLGNATNNVINIDSSGGINIAVAITGVSANLTLNGNSTGILTFSGGAANTYNGTTTINAGELDLNKTGGINAIAGNITVGGGTNAAVLKLLAPSEIADTSVLTFNGTGASAGTFRLNGQNEAVGGISSTGGAGIIENGASGPSILTVGTLAGGHQFTFSGVIRDGPAGTLSLSLSSGGDTLVLSGTNAYTGNTQVFGGTLLVNGSTASGSIVTVNNTGTVLGGTGTVGGATTIQTGAGITGGMKGGVGTLTLGSSLTFSGTSGFLATYFVDLSGATSDKLAIGTSLNLSGTFDQINFFSGAADGTTTYVLATFASRTGMFDAVTNLPSGYQLVYTATEIDLEPVPEPSTWVAAVLGLGAIAVAQLRKRSQTAEPR